MKDWKGKVGEEFTFTLRLWSRPPTKGNTHMGGGEGRKEGIFPLKDLWLCRKQGVPTRKRHRRTVESSSPTLLTAQILYPPTHPTPTGDHGSQDSTHGEDPKLGKPGRGAGGGGKLLLLTSAAGSRLGGLRPDVAEQDRQRGATRARGRCAPSALGLRAGRGGGGGGASSPAGVKEEKRGRVRRRRLLLLLLPVGFPAGLSAPGAAAAAAAVGALHAGQARGSSASPSAHGKVPKSRRSTLRRRSRRLPADQPSSGPPSQPAGGTVP